MNQDLENDDDRPCRIAVVTASEADAEAITHRMQGSVANRANGFTAHVGGLGGHRVVVAAGRRGAESVLDVLDAILSAHRPYLVVAGGPASGLALPAKRNAVLVASEVVSEEGRRLVLGVHDWCPPAGVVGPVLSLARPVRTAAEKRRLAEAYQAVAVDQESFRLAEVCAAEGLPFLALRVVTDGPEDEVPRDIQRLLQRKSRAGKAGAFAGTLFRRPSHLKHLWRLKESLLEAGDRLADNVVRLAQDLPIAGE